MRFFASILLFFLAGFVGYLLNADRGNTLGIVMLIALPIIGVYFLGWLALLPFGFGVVFGGKVFWAAMMRSQ